MKRKLHLCWTCSDFAHHEHRYRWTARFCGWWQYRKWMIINWLIVLVIIAIAVWKKAAR